MLSNYTVTEYTSVGLSLPLFLDQKLLSRETFSFLISISESLFSNVSLKSFLLFLSKSLSESEIPSILWNSPRDIFLISQGGWKLCALKMILQSAVFLKMVVCRSSSSSLKIFRSFHVMKSQDWALNSFLFTKVWI